MKPKKQGKAKQLWYKQCTFRTPTERGEMVETAWLPESLATKGAKIYFGKKTDKPEELWTITSVSDGRLSEDYVSTHERDYLTQRDASDI
jgi:hypothetical protein